MSDRRAIVNPVKGRNPPQTGAMAIVVATQSDFQRIGELTGTSVVEQRQLYMSRLQVRAAGQQRFTIVGPLIGAPFAAMVVETLAVWGVTDILFTGWCGAVSRQVKTGDIILPTSAMVDEGTSNHYNTPPGMPATPALSLVQHVRSALQNRNEAYHEGAIWTTDGIFRETVEKVKHYQKLGALAVEMELSAILSVAAFRNLKAAGLLVVSDELSEYEWRPGFKKPEFKAARETVCRTALALAGGWRNNVKEDD